VSTHERGGTHAESHAPHGAEGHGHAEPQVPVFTGALRQELDEILRRYPTRRAALLPALWIVQRERGWIESSGGDCGISHGLCVVAKCKSVVTHASGALQLSLKN